MLNEYNSKNNRLHKLLERQKFFKTYENNKSKLKIKKKIK